MKLPNPIDWWFRQPPLEEAIVVFKNGEAYTREVKMIPTPDNLLETRREIIAEIGSEAGHTLYTDKRPLPPVEGHVIPNRGIERG